MSSNGKRKIKHMSLRNVAGISEFEVDADGKLVQIVGGNGAGKTTIERAIESIVKGGHDVTLLSNGADEGEIFLLLDDDTEVRKRITTSGSDLYVNHPEHGSISAAKSWVERHLDIMSVNLVDVMLDEKGAELLLEAIPMQVDLDQIRDAVGGAVAITDDIDAEGLGETAEYVDVSQHALEALAQIRKRIYQRRRDVGRDADRKKKSVADLREGLPDDLDSIDTPEAIREERERLKAELQSVKDHGNQASEEATEEIRASLDDVDQRIDAKIEAIDEEITANHDEISELRAKIRKLESRNEQLEQQRASIDEKERAAEKAELNQQLAETKQRIMAEYGPKISALQSKIDGCETRIESAIERASRLARYRENAAERDDLQGQYDELTSVLGRLDNLKTDLLSDLPVEGLEIEDGQIFVDGVPLAGLNTEKRIQLAFQVLKMRGDKAAFVDGAERLETKNLHRLMEEADAAGIQLWTMSVADDQPLTVLGDGQGEDAAPAEVAS